MRTKLSNDEGNSMLVMITDESPLSLDQTEHKEPSDELVEINKKKRQRMNQPTRSNFLHIRFEDCLKSFEAEAGAASYHWRTVEQVGTALKNAKKARRLLEVCTTFPLPFPTSQVL